MWGKKFSCCRGDVDPSPEVSVSSGDEPFDLRFDTSAITVENVKAKWFEVLESEILANKGDYIQIDANGRRDEGDALVLKLLQYFLRVRKITTLYNIWDPEQASPSDVPRDLQWTPKKEYAADGPTRPSSTSSYLYLSEVNENYKTLVHELQCKQSFN